MSDPAEVSEHCMFFPDNDCPVLERMKDFGAMDKIEPIDQSTVEQYAIAVTKSLGSSSSMLLQALAIFCGACPHSKQWAFEKYAKPIFVKLKPGEHPP